MEKTRLIGLWQQFKDRLSSLKTLDLSLSDALKLIQKAAGVLQFPDWRDSGDVRAWALDTLDFLDLLADLTASELDDEVLAWLRNVIANDDTWFTIFGLFVDVIDEGTADGDRVAAAAEKVDLDPAVLVLIIEMALRIFDWWRSR